MTERKRSQSGAFDLDGISRFQHFGVLMMILVGVVVINVVRLYRRIRYGSQAGE